MKKDTKWAVAIAVALGLMGSVPAAKADMAANIAGSALVDAIAGESVAGAWESPGWGDYADFERAADHHSRRSNALAFANIKTKAGDSSDSIGEKNRRAEFKILERVAAANGAFIDGPAGANLGNATFYEGGLPTGGPSLWVCNVDASKAFNYVFSFLSKQQGFDQYGFFKENGVEDPKAAGKFFMNEILTVPKNQGMVVSLMTGKMSAEEFAGKALTLIPEGADFKEEFPPEGVKITKGVVGAYGGLEFEKPGVKVFDSKEECCGEVKEAEHLSDIKERVLSVKD